MTTPRIAALVLAFAACGGANKPDQELDSSRDPQRHEVAAGSAEHAEHGKLPPSVAKFHDTLAPRWHAERGAKRMADTCAAVAQLQTDAGAIVATAAPEGANPAAWSDGGKQLADAVTALEATCKAGDAAAFEPAFERVHTSFHHVMEAGGAH